MHCSTVSKLPRSMNPDAVFKAYDIRGRTDIGELDADLFRLIGGAFVDLTGATSIAVGRDCRNSTPELFAGLSAGLRDAGAEVVDLGEVPTDLVYFYSGSEGVPGAMITASHNPPEYNGLKLCRPGAAPVGAETGLETIKEAVLGRAAPRPGIRGGIRSVDAINPYVDHLMSVVSPPAFNPLRVAVDGGNGMAGVAIDEVFSRIPCELDGLYLELDGTFPNHPPDPIQPENLLDLVNLVKEGGHDLGVAFDGDADRAFFIDDEAEPLSGSTVTSLIARWMLAQHPGSSIVHNLITSHAVPEIVAEHGGTPVRTRVGHSYIKQVMADTDAVFGGEHSGHYYFRDNFRADSGMLAMLVLLQVISEDGRPLSKIRVEVERYAASGEINYQVSDLNQAVAAIELEFAGEKTDRLDGLTVYLGDSWFNLRPSNTEPLLRLNVEAPSPQQVAQVVERVEQTLEDLNESD